MYIEDDYVNENMNYETISEDEIIIGDEIENKNLENNTRKIGNIANSFRIDWNPRHDVETTTFNHYLHVKS